MGFSLQRMYLHSTAPQYTKLLKRIQNSQYLLVMKNPENYFMLSNVAVCLKINETYYLKKKKKVYLIFGTTMKTSIPIKSEN